jgi:hypothetical protein
MAGSGGSIPILCHGLELGTKLVELTLLRFQLGAEDAILFQHVLPRFLARTRDQEHGRDPRKEDQEPRG